MSAHAYTEVQLAEQPAVGLFAKLGWTRVSALDETFGAPSPGLSQRGEEYESELSQNHDDLPQPSPA